MSTIAPLRAVLSHDLFRLVRLAPAQTAATTLAAVTGVVAMLLLPAAAAHATDQVLTGDTIGVGLLALVGLLGLRVLAEASLEVTRASTTTRVTAALRYSLTRQVFTLGVPGLRRYDTGDLVTRLTTNASTGARAVPSMVNVAVEVAASLGGLIALCLIDWRLGAVFVVGVAPAVLLLRVLMRQVASRYSEYLEHQGAIATRLTDALAGSRTIRASGTVAREVTRVLAPLPDLSRVGTSTWEVQRAISWQLDVVMTLVRVVVLGVGGFGVAANRITPGEFLAASLYLGFALGFIYQADTLMFIAHARVNADRVLSVLAEQPQVRADRVGVPPTGSLPPGPGALRFRDVSVRIGDRVVLDRVDLEIPAGSAVAVVGRSGAGKSTLALLAGRLMDPDEGAVLIDRARVDAVDLASLRREVAYAFDRPVLLGRTVRDALGYGQATPAGPGIAHAARIADSEDFIRRLPDGFDTVLADAPFSGGELQRLGLARAVAQGGRILVLDDATSSLDTVTEAKVTRALTEGLAGRTRLVVAHRATTAARADLVAWLDGGRIRALAPHHVLWSTHPDYPAVFINDPGPDSEPGPDEEDA